MGLELVLLILCIGIVGWIGFSVLTLDNSNQEPTDISAWLEQSLVMFLAGFGLSSVFLFLLAVLGEFTRIAILAVFSILLVSYLLLPHVKKSKTIFLKFTRYLVFCLSLAFLVSGLGKLSKPYEAIVGRDDASVYVGTAFQLMKSGALSYTDPLALSMTNTERQAFFRGPEGSYVRFPGGVYFANLSKGLVAFDRFHLFPTWLALGIDFMGINRFLYLLTLFSTLSLICLYFIGSKLGGPLLGISVPSVLFFYYPQFYYSHLPMSELLAQTLFLGGLLIFVSGLMNASVLSAGQQRLVGILWGATFLCRIEMLFFLPLSVALVFSVIPAFAKSLYKWRTLIAYLVIFFLFAFYRQLSTGTYLVVYGLRTQSIMNRVWLPLASRLSEFFQHQALPGALAFIAACLLSVWLIRLLFARERRLHKFVGVCGILLTAMTIFLLLRGYFTWDRFLTHLSWFTVYTSSAGLIVIVAGILASLSINRKTNKASVLWAIFIFCAIPAFFYLIRPLIDVSQPSFARRFVPVVYPSMILLSLCGWLIFFKITLRKWQIVPQILFSVLVISTAFFFFKKSSYLIRDPLFVDAITQTERIASKIPEKALVLIPDTSKVFHMEIPIHYVMNRDTIALPPDEGYDAVIHSFLESQLKKGRSILFLSNANDPLDRSLRNFDLQVRFADTLTFSSVGDFPVNNFPDHIASTQLNYTVFGLQRSARPVSKSEIVFNDPDVEFFNFNWAESQFRWSRGESELRNFLFQTEQKTISLVLSLADQYLPYKGNDINLSLLVNDKFPASFSKQQNGDFYFRLDCKQIPAITSVTIRSNSFIPKNLKINLDPRTLGITFVKLRFIRENESASH